MFKWVVENESGEMLFICDTEAEAKQYIDVRNYTTLKKYIKPLLICQYKMKKISETEIK